MPTCIGEKLKWVVKNRFLQTLPEGHCAGVIFIRPTREQNSKEKLFPEKHYGAIVLTGVHSSIMWWFPLRGILSVPGREIFQVMHYAKLNHDQVKFPEKIFQFIRTHSPTLGGPETIQNPFPRGFPSKGFLSYKNFYIKYAANER